jgi:hypothetical protein
MLNKVQPVSLLKTCYSRLLGPLNSADELLSESPHGFYTVGILDSAEKQIEGELYKGEEIPEDKAGYGEEEAEEEEIYLYTQSRIDPRNFPFSAGLSFICMPDENNKINFKIYLSYAVYQKREVKEKEEKKFLFKRDPCVYELDTDIKENISIRNQEISITSKSDHIKLSLPENTELFIRYFKQIKSISKRQKPFRKRFGPFDNIYTFQFQNITGTSREL